MSCGCRKCELRELKASFSLISKNFKTKTQADVMISEFKQQAEKINLTRGPFCSLETEDYLGDGPEEPPRKMKLRIPSPDQKGHMIDSLKYSMLGGLKTMYSPDKDGLNKFQTMNGPPTMIQQDPPRKRLGWVGCTHKRAISIGAEPYFYCSLCGDKL